MNVTLLHLLWEKAFYAGTNAFTNSPLGSVDSGHIHLLGLYVPSVSSFAVFSWLDRQRQHILGDDGLLCLCLMHKTTRAPTMPMLVLWFTFKFLYIDARRQHRHW